MIEYIIFALLFFAPAGLANAAPVFANKIPLLNRWKTPVDLGRHYRGKRILGNNKTWRGLIVGILTGTLTGIVIYLLFPDFVEELGLRISSPLPSMAILGGVLGAGALLGDIVESFFKRQAGVSSGQPWFPFDQIDYIIGGLLTSSMFIELSWQQRLAVLLVWFGLHLLSSFIGYLIGLKDEPI